MIVDPDSLKEKEIDLLSSSAIVTNSQVTKNILILLKYEYRPTLHIVCNHSPTLRS